MSEISDFWYKNGKVRLWKSYDEYFWKTAKRVDNPPCVQIGMGGGQITDSRKCN